MELSKPHQSELRSSHRVNIGSTTAVAYQHESNHLAMCNTESEITIFRRVNRTWQQIHSISRDSHTHKSIIRFMCWSHPVFGYILFTASTSDRVVNVFELQINADHELEFIRTASFTLQNEIRGISTSHAKGLQLSIVTSGSVLLAVPIQRGCTGKKEWKISQQVIVNQHTLPSFGSLPFNGSITNKRSNRSGSKIDEYLNGNTEIFCVSWNNSHHETLSTFAVGATQNRVFLYGHSIDAQKGDNVVIKKRLHVDWKCIEIIKVDAECRFDVVSIAWCNHVARQKHFIALGCSDGMLRVISIFKKEGKLEWKMVFKKKANINNGGFKVEWNQTGTCLVTSGQDSRLILWKKVRDTFIKTMIEPLVGREMNTKGMDIEEEDNMMNMNQHEEERKDIIEVEEETMQTNNGFGSSFGTGVSSGFGDGNNNNNNNMKSNTGFGGWGTSDGNNGSVNHNDTGFGGSSWGAATTKTENDGNMNDGAGFGGTSWGSGTGDSGGFSWGSSTTNQQSNNNEKWKF